MLSELDNTFNLEIKFENGALILVKGKGKVGFVVFIL